MIATRSLAAIEMSVKSLFSDDVAAAVERIVTENERELRPEERAAIVGAVPARLAEFATGRVAARRALRSLGHDPVALPVGPDRAPIWPVGIAGSITHADGIAVAVARWGRPIGIDIEEDTPLALDLWPVICDQSELDRLPPSDRGRMVRHVFAAKEALFKAQEDGQRAMFGFDAVSVTLADGGFAAKFCRDAGAFRDGQVVHGRQVSGNGLILAGVAW
jgi:4'-phosphopantetheinyl transferase EntD